MCFDWPARCFTAIRFALRMPFILLRRFFLHGQVQGLVGHLSVLTAVSAMPPKAKASNQFLRLPIQLRNHPGFHK
jgi:hypothetical protein